MMKIIYCDHLPVSGFKCMNICGVLIVRTDCKDKITDITINHESIHTAQYKEVTIVLGLLMLLLIATFGLSWWWMLLTPALYYLRYITAWVVQGVLPPYDEAYHDIPFEEEAYDNQDNLEYLDDRTPFSWVRYMYKDL